MPIAPTTSTLVFFGDSLSDPGNLFDLGAGLIADELRNQIAGPTQSVSDGEVFAEYLADLLNPDSVLNYAIAGAEAAGTQTLADLVVASGFEDDLLVPLDDPALDVDINIGAQIDRFMEDHPVAPLTDFTAVLLAGGNDYSGIDPSDPAAAFAEVLAQLAATTGAILSAANTLAQAGVGAVQVIALPPASFFPSAAGLAPSELFLAELVFGAHNTILENWVPALGGAVELISLDPLIQALQDDAESFGFLAPLTAELTADDGAILDQFDADQVAFYDDIHPSTALHGVIAKFLETQGQVGDVVLGNDFGSITGAGSGGGLIFGLGGADLIFGGAAVDVVFGGSDTDELVGLGSADILAAGSGDDEVYAGDGADIVAGGSGADILAGQDGADLIIDGLGSDQAFGGSGDDAFIFQQNTLIGGTGSDSDLFVGGSGTDTLYLVLDAATADIVGDTVSMGELAALGITAFGIENIEVLRGREALNDLTGVNGLADADLWGLI